MELSFEDEIENDVVDGKKTSRVSRTKTNPLVACTLLDWPTIFHTKKETMLSSIDSKNVRSKPNESNYADAL